VLYFPPIPYFFAQLPSNAPKITLHNTSHVYNQNTNTYNTHNKKKSNWIGHILHRNCLVKHVIEGKIEGQYNVQEDNEGEEAATGWP
jgi:hypothetical protein